MRWWWIVLFIGLFAWVILVGPPQSWAPFFHTPFMHFLDFLGPLIISIVTLPGRWVLSHIWGGFFDLTLVQFWQGAPFYKVAIACFAWTFTIVFSYAFWITALSRFWKFIGRWNPFGSNIFLARPHVLRMAVAISNWREREFHFGEHATGRFASIFEILSNEFQAGDIFLGRPKLLIGGMLRPIGISTEKHMVTIAGTGSGKSTGALIPNLCCFANSGSLLCVDPKGELAAITARRRGNGGGGVVGMGQRVFVLDPFHIVPGFQTASYNVFDEMERVAQYDVDRPVSYARKISQALVPSTSKDPYWDDAPRTFISGLLLYIFQGPKEHRNLVRLRALLMEGDVTTYLHIREAGGDATGDAFDALLTMMKNCPEGPYHHVIVGSANSLSKMSRNQRGSVLTMAMEHTSFLDMPEIRKISMTSDFLLEDLKNSHISVYLCLPLNAVSGIEGRWLRMFVLLTVDMMTRVNKAPKPPLLLAIDEFPSLGKLDGIETVAPTMRSQGVRLWVVGQDIEQFEKVYPESWGSFIGGAEAVQFMGITHPPTVAYIAERLGQHVVIERQQVGGGQVRESASERPLRDPEQIARMLSKDGKNQIIWRGNKRPMLLKVCPYFEYMPWWQYSRDRRFREKWNRWIWRRGKDYDIPPPTMPPHNPPPKPPDDRHDDGIRSYLPEPHIEPSDNVPGTKTTWEEAVRNYGERATGWVQRVEQKLDKISKEPPKTYFGADPPKTPEQMKADTDHITEYLRLRAVEDAKLFQPMTPEKAPEKAADNPLRQDTRLPPVERKEKQALPSKPNAGGNNLSGSLRELDELIGLDEVKKQVHKTVNLVQLGRERERKGLPHLPVTHHLVFTGNPGTGKTTVARIVGQIYREIGLLKKGHMVEAKRADLIAQYVGHTAPLVKTVIETAMDGVLFIDEAYSLTPTGGQHDFAAEAVAALLTGMEDNRDRLVVIAAGYREEMEKFINSNPGLKSRFKTIIDFEDYSGEDLLRIFVQMGAVAGIRPSLDAQIAIANLMESLDTGKKGFGNGRTVRNIFEECFGRQAGRLGTKGKKVDVTVFEEEDIPKPGEMLFS
jgi:stage V sporulation protein K